MVAEESSSKARRARSFGVAADAYDLYRPQYPESLLESLVVRDGLRVLDVGAGTGIASTQLRALGARVLAVEPDPQMAAVAVAKGIEVEQASFEDWLPAGRRFDLVVFAQSFHWVDPRVGLAKASSVLEPGGRLALLWNRIVAVSPDQGNLDRVYADYALAGAQPSVDDESSLASLLEQFGFSVERRDYHEHVQYDGEAWLNMVFTYSNHLALEPQTSVELRARLVEHIGQSGVRAENRGIALVCTPRL